MKKFIITISLILISSRVHSYDELYSHEQFETGPLPKIINYDPEFRPPIAMPELEPGALPDDEPYESDTTYDIQFRKVEDQ